MMRTSIVRATRAAAVPRASVTSQLQHFRQAHAISNPTLANIEQRWEDLVNFATLQDVGRR